MVVLMVGQALVGKEVSREMLAGVAAGMRDLYAKRLPEGPKLFEPVGPWESERKKPERKPGKL